ncbi:MAG: hypothetical protein HFI51_13185 [Lachnospiraceae bacterium]|nr:hypothetical protein [Lachnospiraceae bacterium]
MKIWAHRGCSQMYPENTLLAFEKAAELDGLEGIEFDIQMTKDGELVVIHDERVDRTTEGTGYVKDYLFSQLRRLHIYAGSDRSQSIPAIEEVLDLLEDKIRSGLKINIELKNSIFPYEGMEEKIVSLINRRGMQESVVYSSFNALSVEKIRKISGGGKTGILDRNVSDCLYKLKGGCGAEALHPYWKGMDLPFEMIRDYTVRAYFAGHLYPEKPTGTRLDLTALARRGITDVFLNEPERYL